MAKSPPPPEFDVALVTVPNGKITAVWWEWLQRYVKWDEACCEAGSGDGGGGGDSGVSEIVGTPPVVVTGTALLEAPEALAAGAVTISMPPATESANGYLKATDWTTFNGKEPTITAGTTSQWWRGDKSWQALPATTWGSITGIPSTFPPTLPIAQSGVTNLVSDLATKAPLASPVFTGDPQAPTAALGDSDTSIATTAFVSAAVSNTFAGGMSTAEYTYSTTTTTPPSTGQLRANTTTQNAITAFYLHETNAVGIDITNALKLITTGVKILCQDKTNAANVQYYVVTAPAVDNGVYFTIPVTWTTGGSNFTAGRVIFAGFGIGSNNMPEAPTDGQIYGRRGSDSSWQVATGTFTDAPSDNGEYVRRNGVWRLKSQSLDMSGLTVADIAIPTGAKAVTLDATFLITGAATYLGLRVSDDGTTFRSGATDYNVLGPVHNTGSGGYTVNAGVATSLFQVSVQGDSTTVYQHANIYLNIIRPASGFHRMRSFAQSFDSAAGTQYRTTWQHGITSSAGTPLKALRLLLFTGAAFGVNSFVDARWSY